MPLPRPHTAWFRQDVGADEGEGFGFAAKHAGQRLAALADDDNHLALAGTVLAQPPIAPVLALVGGLHIAATVAAIDCRAFAVAADFERADFRPHRLAHLVRQDKGGLVLRPEIAAEGQHRLALDRVGEDRNRHEVGAQWHLAAGEQRPAGQREVLVARLALPAQATLAAAAVNRGAAAFRVIWLAAIVGPAQPDKDPLGFLVRHPGNRRQRERPGGG
jgi:hypothetical protein